jgi:hypothetical protein
MDLDSSDLSNTNTIGETERYLSLKMPLVCNFG